MGLEWSAPKKVKQNTLILVKAKIPEKGQPMNNEIWTLYRSRKAALKTDGFGVGKDTYAGGLWDVTYFHEIGPNTYEKNNQGKYLWEVDFNKKVAKYTAVIQNLQSTLENPEDIQFKAPPQKYQRGKGRGGGRGGGGGGVDTVGPVGGSTTTMDDLMAEFDDLDVDDGSDDFN